MKPNSQNDFQELRDKQILTLNTFDNDTIFKTLLNNFKAMDDREFKKFRTRDDIEILIYGTFGILKERNITFEDDNGKQVFVPEVRQRFTYREKLVRFYNGRDKHFTKILIIAQ